MHERQNFMDMPAPRTQTRIGLETGHPSTAHDSNLLGAKFFLRQGKLLKSQQSKHRQRLPGVGKGLTNDKISLPTSERPDMAAVAWYPKGGHPIPLTHTLTDLESSVPSSL